MPKPLPTLERLKELLEYNPDGSLTWKQKRSRKMTAKAQAGCINARKYFTMKIDYTQYLVHRIIWKIHYGTEPEYIDHINGNPSDNRIENLRAATCSQNNANRKSKGYRDKSCEGRSKPYQAFLKVDGKNIHLGYFHCPLMAHLEYQKAHIKQYKEFSPYYVAS